MMKVFIVVSLVFVLCASFKPCQPFGTRLFYGNIIANPNDSQKLEIYFNTLSSLPKQGKKNIQCTIQSLQLSKKTQNYKTSIHKCSTSEINFQEEFVYNIYGWDGISQKIAYSKSPISVTIPDITNLNRKLNLIVLADWSELSEKADIYMKLDDLFSKILQQKQINGLVINGDIGYDLDTNNCLNYQKFLIMISEYSQKIPIIIITGNHQYNSQDNYQLFTSSFQLYGLDKQLAVNLYLGNMNMIAFDPFQAVLKNSVKDPTIDKFQAALSIAKNSGRYVIPFSHYPLACSGFKLCLTNRDIMSNYWNAMFKAKVSLYIGAHYHTYQRIYPYLADGSFSHQADGYRSDQNYIISIVEGVAGNSNYIIEEMQTIQPFTASYTVNETGFGVLSINTKTVYYEHYSTLRGLSDSFSIALVNNKLIRQD